MLLPNGQRTSVYYAALDAEAFPSWDRRSKEKINEIEQVAYIKALSLLVDNIVIPPSYLIRLITDKSSYGELQRTFGEFIENKSILTSVYQGMASPVDFVDMKANEGDEKERAEFGKKLDQAKLLYKSMPFIDRNVKAQVSGFKNRVLDGIRGSISLDDDSKEQVICALECEERRGKLRFGRALIIKVIGELRLPKKHYRAVYYIMNAEYYKGGAIASESDIACVNAHEYSVLGSAIFTDDMNALLVGYDPELFVYVLGCHSITKNEIAALSYKDIEALRNSDIFSEFIDDYNKLIANMQKIEIAENTFGKEYLLELRYKMARDILARFKAEEKYLSSLLLKEDFGVALVLGGLGFVLGGPIGASALAALGLAHPTLRKLSASPIEIITRKIQAGKVPFYLYLQQLQEVVSNART